MTRWVSAPIHAAHSALGTGDVTGSAELKQVTGHWSDSRQAVTGVSPVTR